MAELEFTRGEIDDLARKLTSPQLQLSERERALLLSIFSAACRQVRPRYPEGAAEPTLADLREDLVKAFIPWDAAEFTIDRPNFIVP
ncbi:MAG: hypothetical protein ABSA53_33475 [Streptosporangiaceae bacterium]|jgi:hypothetical protein